MRPNDNELQRIANTKMNNNTGINQIRLKFKDELTDLLSYNYYEGTKYSNKNIFDHNGNSKIYVMQDNLHKQLDYFLTDSMSSVAFLVGYTGVGKTTLLRNFFKVYDRNPVIRDDTIIMYKSFQSDEIGNGSTKDSVARHIMYTIYKIMQENESSIDFNEYDKHLIDYIEGNKGEVLFNKPITSRNYQLLRQEKDCNSILEDYYKEDALGYALMNLKYFLVTLKKYKNIIFIFDDVERHNKDVQLDFINNTISKVVSCFAAIEIPIKIKTIVSLRNYLHRAINARQIAALRNDPFIILKNEIPSLSQIVQKRFEVFSESEGIRTSSYKDAKKELDIIFGKLYYNYDELIMNLTQKNIFKSLLLFTKMLTNKKYIGNNEVSHGGAFVIDALKYHFKNDDVVYAFAYGEGDVYIPDQCIFSNILYNNYSDYSFGDIVSLYVIIYYSQFTQLYGENAIPVQDILDELDSIFSEYTDTVVGENIMFSERAVDIIKKLYSMGVLLKSIHDIEVEADFYDDSIRTCDEQSLLYLSPKGKELYDMLRKNALYFNIVRDDIDTNLHNNQNISAKLSESEKLIYFFEYIKTIFEKEKMFISAARNQLKKYHNAFGCNLITSLLLESFVQSAKTFFTAQKTDSDGLIQNFCIFYAEVENYITYMNAEFMSSFTISESVKDYYEEQNHRYETIVN